MSSNLTGTREDIQFRTGLFGFDKTEVRALVSKLLDELERALAKVEALRQAGQGERAGEPSLEQNAHMVERVLASAHRVADEIRTEAERDAERLLAEAREKAARMLAEAATTAQEMSDAAANRLRTVERETEQMRTAHREVRSALEAAVAALGVTLAEVSAFASSSVQSPPNSCKITSMRAFRLLDAAQHIDGEDTDPLKKFAEEQETKAGRS